MAAEANGSTVLAAFGDATAAIPAGIAVGTMTTGHHIILLPKLAPSCEKKISAAVMAAPPAVSADSDLSKRPVRTSCRAVVSRATSILVSREILLHFLFQALLDEACSVFVAVQHCLGDG